MREEGGPGAFEVDEKDEGLVWVGVEDAVAAFAAVVEFRGWVLVLEDADERVDVEFAEGAVDG